MHTASAVTVGLPNDANWLANTPAASVIKQLTQHATILHAPYSRMVISDYNVRVRNTNDDELEALVAAHGILQNLVCFQRTTEGVNSELLDVVCGRRRHKVVGNLIAKGIFPEDYHLPYMLITEAEAIAISLAENLGREGMHPADVFEAMLALSKRGCSVQDIGLSFRVDPQEVKRRLKLANVSSALFNLYRNDQASFEQMAALAITDDHTAQEHAWHACPSRNPYDLKRLLTAHHIDVMNDRLARFVGIKRFEQAGGHIVRDLFSPVDSGYTDDTALLERLATNKLRKHSEELMKTDGVHWVDIQPRADAATLCTYGRVRMVPEPLDDTRAMWLSAIEARIAELSERARELAEEEADAELDRVTAEGDELEDHARAIRDGRAIVPHPDDAALAGAVVAVDSAGAVQVTRNLIRPNDRTKLPPLVDDVPTEFVAPVRRKPDQSRRLHAELTALRTVAIQAELMDQGELALRYLTYTMMRQTFMPLPEPTLARVSLAIAPVSPDAAESAAGKSADARVNQLRDLIPDEDAGEHWLTWLVGQPQSTVIDILACCVAKTLDAVPSREDDAEFKILAKALNLDMTKWWKPTAEGFFQLPAQGPHDRGRAIGGLQRGRRATGVHEKGRCRGRCGARDGRRQMAARFSDLHVTQR